MKNCTAIEVKYINIARTVDDSIVRIAKNNADFMSSFLNKDALQKIKSIMAIIVNTNKASKKNKDIPKKTLTALSIKLPNLDKKKIKPLTDKEPMRGVVSHVKF